MLQSEVNQSLVLAAKEGLIDLVRELLAKPGVNVDYNEYKVHFYDKHLHVLPIDRI